MDRISKGERLLGEDNWNHAHGSMDNKTWFLLHQPPRLHHLHHSQPRHHSLLHTIHQKGRRPHQNRPVKPDSPHQELDPTPQLPLRCLEKNRLLQENRITLVPHEPKLPKQLKLSPKSLRIIAVEDYDTIDQHLRARLEAHLESPLDFQKHDQLRAQDSTAPQVGYIGFQARPIHDDKAAPQEYAEEEKAAGQEARVLGDENWQVGPVQAQFLIEVDFGLEILIDIQE
ncbi:eukaryotic translation initiation factor 3subunit H [Striga asiatica]|uniref:Eukaryotic translation initiation factor 3subunit H n=1 Tax=Striga asiatica TaxID=4170 RepID=A0A5A7QT39_STRAF|nr:eukaryotic translation initiation factor 3subunit H [Striga asiatica]